jgi:hypothetical protein
MWKLTLLLLGCVAFSVFVSLAWPKAQITQASYLGIQPGMTALQVESLLGGPPEPGCEVIRDADGVVRVGRYWSGVVLDVVVAFDDDGKALSKDCYRPGSQQSEARVLDKLRAWLP